jgi:hypothetical protein
MSNKKTYVSVAAFIVFIFILFCSDIWADSFGTLSSTLKKGQWMMSLEGYGALDRDLKYSGGTVDAIYWGIYHGRGYGLTDRISIFGKVGYHDLDVDPNPFKNKEESLKGGMAGGLYLKGVIFKDPESLFEVGVGGGYLYCSAHHDNGPKYDWREWQIGGYASKEFGRFTPYVGLKYSDLDSKLKFKEKPGEGDVRGGSIEVESDDKIGAFVGVNVFLSQDKDVYLNCEVNFISSLEIGAGLYYKF